MPTSQYKEQSGHCISEEISHSSKCSVLPMLVIDSFDFSLNGLNSSILIKSSINESRFWWFSNCWNSLFPISLRLFFLNCWVRFSLNSVINVTASTSSDEFPRTSRFVRFDGQRVFSLPDWKDPDVHDKSSAWVRLAGTLGIGLRCSLNPLQSSCFPLSQYISQVVCWKERLRGIVFDR